MQGRRPFWIVGCWLWIGSFGLAADQPPDLPTTKHQVTGLFSKERVPDLEKAARELLGIELVRVDFATAEAEFRYDVAKVFPNSTPDQIVERFDQMLRNASRHTFGIKPLCSTPREQLECVEIGVLGLDCKACCLAAYESVYKLDGVEQATVSFKDGVVAAWIHPGRVDVKMLEAALKQRNVTLKESARP